MPPFIPVEFSTRDRILRATGEKVEIRFVLVDATVAADQIADKHGARGFARQLIGEAAAAALLLASGLKWPGTVQMRFSLSGDINKLAADATPLGLVRAMIPKEELERTGSFEPMVLPRSLTVRKLDREGRVLSEGVVEMVSPEISASLMHYLEQSEQTKSLARVAAVCDESGERLLFCGGFLLEAFPGVRDEDWIPVMHIAESLDFGSFIRTAKAKGEAKNEAIEEPQETGGLDLARIFAALTAPFPAQVHQEFGVEPYCPCSEKGVLQALTGLGREELEVMYLGGEDVEVFCEFCRKRYVVPAERLKELLEEVEEVEGAPEADDPDGKEEEGGALPEDL